ncbi:MAG: 50S ribosomal protein L10 [Oscillospiraceae bacterium]|jgi:large subunit ribosomal protein L10|nr:50S ribosomal protein L10 [Oscillospiraceae bacterium]
MPNAKVLSEKQAVVETLTEKLRGISGVFVDYSGITVAEDTEMRAKLRAENVDYSVVKNTLMRFAAKNVGLDALDPILNGTTSLAVSKDDAVAPARIIKEYAGKFTEHFTIKGGFYDGKVLSAAEVESLASIPALPVLQAQVLGTMLAPITALAIVIKAIAEKDGGSVDVAQAVEVVEAVIEAAPAVEEAPVEAAPAVEETPAEPEAPAEEAAPEAAE